MKYFLSSHVICLLALAVSFFWGQWEAVFICALLTVFEVTFSIENAIVNAAVLKHMNHLWQQRFLTWGMVIAVFGMRLIFPIVIVAFATSLSVVEVARIAIENPQEYTRHVLASHVQIGAFGGMFLLMVFLKFILDKNKDLHWIYLIESRLVHLGKLEAIEIVLALCVLLVAQHYLGDEHKMEAMIAGVVGVVLYVVVDGVTALIANPDGKHSAANAVYSGVSGFIYLQFLDASFSLDSVIGAFAISKDIIIIMLGLGAGAMYVRSLTVYLVRKGTLEQYQFLIHGAHWGIGALAIIMLVSMVQPVPEVVTGFIGLGFIGLALISSVRHNRNMSS